MLAIWCLKGLALALGNLRFKCDDWWNLAVKCTLAIDIYIMTPKPSRGWNPPVNWLHHNVAGLRATTARRENKSHCLHEKLIYFNEKVLCRIRIESLSPLFPWFFKEAITVVNRPAFLALGNLFVDQHSLPNHFKVLDSSSTFWQSDIISMPHVLSEV